jgi:hypothetical protein
LAIAGVTALALLEPELELLPVPVPVVVLDLLLLPQPAATTATHARITPALTSFLFTILLLTCFPRCE